MGSNTAHAKVGAYEAPNKTWVGESPTPRTSFPILDVDGWTDKLFRRSSSQETVDAATKALGMFERFAMQRYPSLRGLHLAYPYTDGLLSALNAGQLDVYKVLDSFAGFASRKIVAMNDGKEAPIKPRTVSNRVFSIANLMRFHDLQVLKETFKQKVTLPKCSEIEDPPVTADKLRKLYTCSTLLFQTLILVLTSSGMRIGETMQLRVKDADFNSAKPAAILHLRANTTKTDTARDVFISDEAALALQSWILVKVKQEDDLLFFPRKQVGKRDTKHMRRYYTKLLKKAGLAQKIENHKYYQLHLHNIGRKYFFSKTVGIIGETASHALMGHSFYLKTYYHKPLEERLADYLRTMPTLSFLKATQVSSTKHFDVKSVVKSDEKTILNLLEQGYSYAQDLNGGAVYKKELG